MRPIWIWTSNKKTFITKILFKLHQFVNFYSESLSIQITALMYDINYFVSYKLDLERQIQFNLYLIKSAQGEDKSI